MPSETSKSAEMSLSVPKTAAGNKFSRAALSRAFSSLGTKIGTRPIIFLSVSIAVSLIAAIGIPAFATMEEELPKLWAESGGRLEAEQDYNKAFDYSARSYSTDLAILTAESGTPANMLTQSRLNELLNLQKKIRDLRVPVTYESGTSKRTLRIGINEICYKPPITVALMEQIILSTLDGSNSTLVEDAEAIAQLFQPMIQAAMPCIRINILDCFKEGGYDFDFPGGMPDTVNSLSEAINLLNSSKPVNLTEEFAKYNIDIYTYDKRLSFQSATKEQIAKAASGNCTGWAQLPAMEWPEQTIAGGVTRNADGIVTSIAAFQSIFQIASSDMIAWRNNIPRELAEQAVIAWNKAFTDAMQEWDASDQVAPTSSISAVSSESYDNVLKEAVSKSIHF